MKKYFLLINVIIGFGCSQTVKKTDVLSTDDMVALLIDIHILEAQIDKLRLKTDSGKMIYNTLELELFEKHEVDKARYEESYQFYLSEPDKLNDIYAIVVDSLNVFQKRGYQANKQLMQPIEVERRALEESSVHDKKVIKIGRAKEKGLIKPNLN